MVVKLVVKLEGSGRTAHHVAGSAQGMVASGGLRSEGSQGSSHPPCQRGIVNSARPGRSTSAQD